jgi:hypothetical protein
MKKTPVVFLALCAAVIMCGLAYADCPDISITCAKQMGSGQNAINAGHFKTGTCWKKWACEICKDGASLAQECNSKFSACEGNCAACSPPSSDIYGPDRPCWDKTGKVVYLGGL